MYLKLYSTQININSKTITVIIGLHVAPTKALMEVV